MNHPLSALFADSRGVSSVVGYTLLVILIFGSLVIILTVGTDAMLQTQQYSELERAEHSMTLLDSRAAMVALGTSNTQTLSFGQGSGSFDSLPDAGWLRINHVNYTAEETETLYNGTLGAFVYRNDGTEIAYQGGGVWRQDPDGATRMLSPPEFHYRDATLTLPIIRTVGSVNSGTAPYASVSTRDEARQVFPNRTRATSDGPGAPYDLPAGDGREYLNPLDNGTVEIQVHSEYYEGWASYFRERTSGQVEVFDDKQTVHLTLISLHGSIGEFPMPPENEGVSVEGMDKGHPVTEFTLNLSEGQTSGGENHWAMYTMDGYNQFEIHVKLGNKFPSECEARISVFYQNLSTGEHEEWETAQLTDSSPAVSCSPSSIELDLTNDVETIEYREIDGVAGNSGTKFCFGPQIGEPTDTGMTLNEHPDEDPTARTFEPGADDTESLNFTVNHYLARLGFDYSLVVKDAQGNFCPAGSGSNDNGNGGGSDSIAEDQSSGVLRFKESTAARYVTFLHITENRIEVDLS